MKFYEFTNVTNTSAEILVYGDIVTEKPWWADNDDGFSAQNDFIRDLEALGPKDEIVVRINSFGGEVFAATAMATHLKQNAAKVIAKIDGVSASAATIISSAADVTQMVNNGIFMVHDPMLFLFGSYNENELSGVQRALVAVKKAILNSYKTKTGLSDDELSDIMSKETWMTAQEAKDFGFIDEILFDDTVSGSISNDAKHIFYNSVDHDISKFDFKNVPVSKFKNLVKKPVNKTDGNGTVKKEADNLAKNSKGGNVHMTLEEFKKDNPELYNQIVNSVLDGERARMQGIDEISNTMSQEMVKEAKYTNFSTPQDLALAALKAQSAKGGEFLNKMTNDLKADAVKDSAEQQETTVVPVAEAKPATEKKQLTAKEAVTNKVVASVQDIDRSRRGLGNAK